MPITQRCFTFLSLLLLLALPMRAGGESTVFVQGIVRDASTGEPIPYASITVSSEGRGAVCDDHGIFGITLPESASELSVSCMGYDKATVPLKRTSHNLYEVRLQPSTTELGEVVVRRRRYSKRNNPAVDFVQRIRHSSDLTDPRRNPWYSFDKYERITLAINDFNVADTNSAALRRFPFLVEHIDTSEVSGKTLLNISVNETSSSEYYRHDPATHREIVRGVRSAGFDELLDKKSLQIFYQDVLAEVDLYQNDIAILQNRFVSPLSRIGPDFYKYYLTDTLDVEGERCIVLAFYPHNRASFGFVGQVYVPLGDTTMFIRKVEMRKPAGSNVNFIDNLLISQTYERAPDGSRLKTSDEMIIEARIMPGTPALYARRAVVYRNHSFEQPDNLDVFGGLGATITVPQALDRDDSWWDAARFKPIQHGERTMAQLVERMRQVPLFYWTEKCLKILFTGYIQTGKPSKFDYGPVNTTVSYNAVEGVRLRAGGMTTANLSSRWFGRGYVAWGTRDHKWKYRGELEYSFHDKTYHSREFPVHSLRASWMYDIDRLGQHYLYTNQDNFVLSLKRMSDDRVTYHRVGELEYTLELANNFSLWASMRYERQEATRWLAFTDGYGRNFAHYDETSFALQLRYAPGEKYYQTKTHRIPINLDAPIFTLRHTFAPRGFMGSKYMINTTEANVSKRFWLSAFGFVDVMAGAGHVWSAAPFPNLLIPNANLSYIILPQSYALMNPMEFVNSSYVSWDVAYWLNGALFNLVPGLKKLRLREVVNFRGLYGHLSRRCDPACDPELFVFPADANVQRMDHGPYMELSAGLDNIFGCLRVDYAWRLTYRHMPYHIDRSGLRLAVHMTF